MMSTPADNYKNFAFISYSHRDMPVAKWLQKHLEAYRLPVEIHNDIEGAGRYLRPVFRDESDLNTGILSDELRNNLEQSKFLLLICSKNSADSKWVSDEAKAFVEMGRLNRIIPVIIPDGNTPELQLFPKYLRDYFTAHPDTELLGINIKSNGKAKTLVRIVSRMLDVSFDSLWNRYQRQKRNKIVISSFSLLILALTLYIFAIPVRLSLDVYIEKSELPVGENVFLNVNGAEYSAPVTDPVFEKIKLPGYWRFKDVSVKVSSQFFNQIDTMIRPGFGTSKRIILSLHRDRTFADYSGIVYDDEMEPLQGAEVRIKDFETVTDSEGKFTISIPLTEQRVELPIKIYKPGYKSIEREDETPGEELKFIMHRL